MKVGIIGCGQIANLHAKIYRLIEKTEIVAVADSDYGRARNFGQKFGVPHAFKDYFDLLENNEIDYVDICTPTSTHAEIACNAAKSGVNILLEKPMARTVEECSRIIDESRKKRVKLCPVHNLLFFPIVALLKQMIDTGEYNLASIRTSYKIWKEPDRSPKWVFTPEEKGILWEYGYHLAYLQLEFLKDIRNIRACARKLKYSVYDKIGAFLSTPELNYGILELSAVSKQREFTLEVDNTNGIRVKIDFDNNTYTEMPELRQNKENRFFHVVKKLVDSICVSKTKKTGLGYSVGHYQLIRKFIDSIEHDTLPPVEPESGREVTGLLSRIEESIGEQSSR